MIFCGKFWQNIGLAPNPPILVRNSFSSNLLSLLVLDLSIFYKKIITRHNWFLQRPSKCAGSFAVKFSNAFNATMVDNLTFSRKSTPVSVLVTFSVIFVGKTNCSRNTIQMSGIYRINLHSCGTTFSPAIDNLCLFLHNHEWGIHIFTSGGSRISHTGGSTNTRRGAPTYLAKQLPKTA